MEFTLTPAAQKFFRRLLMFDGGPGSGLRLLVSPGGCSGLSSQFTVEPAPLAGDQIHECQEIRFFLPAQSRLILDGVTVDFTDTPLQSGLVFHDPKAKACGCASEAAAPQGKAELVQLG